MEANTILDRTGHPDVLGRCGFGNFSALPRCGCRVFLIRDARHRGRKDILKEVRTNQDPTLLLEFHDVKRKVEAMEAAEAAGAAQRGKPVPIVLPLTNRHNVVSEKREEMNSFSNPNYRSPFVREASVSSTSAKIDVVAHDQQQQQHKDVANDHVVPKQHQQPTEVVVEVHAEPRQQQQPVVAKTRANPQQQEQQPEVVVVAAKVPAPLEPQQQQQPLDVVEAKPRFSSALSDIRSKLEHIFESRSVQQKQQEPEVVVVAARPDKQQQPRQVVATVQQQQQQQQEVVDASVLAKPEKEIIYASLVFKPPLGPKRELVAVAPGQTATIQRSSIKMRRAPPPPTLHKPALPFAGVAKGGTLPRPQKLVPTMASHQATSSAALDQAAGATPTKGDPPPPPQRQSSLRSLNSLRRARPMRAESKRDITTQFINGLLEDEDHFVTYV